MVSPKRRPPKMTMNIGLVIVRVIESANGNTVTPVYQKMQQNVQIKPFMCTLSC